MPSTLHPQAKFDPIPANLDLHGLVAETANFEWATHISASEIFTLGQQRFEQLVYFHVIHGGKPLVINDWNQRLPKQLFSAQWLQEHYDKKAENVWDINNQAQVPMTMGHYLRSMKQLTEQWTPRNFRDERRQRLYLKDMDCPPEWQERLRKALPQSIFYLNESVEAKGGGGGCDGAGGCDDGDDGMFVDTQHAVRAGDLMSSLPPAMRAENLMCYVGHEGTYTPAHREMCASLGQNIMVEASGSTDGERPGSSIWFMTETKDREVVSEYFLSMLGHDVEIEKHFAQINAWKKATFPVYIVEQRPGDLILVPPLAPHQVWNRGTRTIKVAWNRTVVETLEMALHEALPKARLVCRDEQYKNKAIIYYTLGKYHDELVAARTDQQLASTYGIGPDEGGRRPVRTQQVADDFKRLLQLFGEMLVDEMFGSRERDVEYVAFDSNITCSYCRANIFNRFLTCRHCTRLLVGGDEDTYDVCMECYAMGRSCACVAQLSWCEQWPWATLVADYERWRAMVISNDGFIDVLESPPALEVARLRTGRKPVAQICQEQLRRRPFRDIHAPVSRAVLPDELSEPDVDEDGRVRKKKKKRPQRQPKNGDTYRCHSCCHKDHRHRLAFCTTPGCQEAYCYGVLYRGFDMMPQTVMQKEFWRCPRCEGICNCGACRRGGLTKPYVPKSTLLGHDTRAIADDRSVESLINFRLHNLLWLRNAGEESRSKDSKRMRRLRAAADQAKAAGDLEGGMEWMEHGGQGGQGGQAGGPDSQNSQESHGDAGPLAGHVDQYGAYTAAAPPAVMVLDDDERAGMATHAAHVEAQAQAQVPPPPAHGPDTDYPDPTRASNEMMAMFGRAYYQNDDGPDRILFDPYREPLPHQVLPGFEAMAEPPEFLDSFSYRSVRRPRLDKDLDPDYQPRSQRRKVRPAADGAGGGEQEMYLDPALLSVAAAPAPAVAVAVVPTRLVVAAGPVAGVILRHAQPKASYVVEVESDGEGEDARETVEASLPDGRKTTTKTTTDARKRTRLSDDLGTLGSAVSNSLADSQADGGGSPPPAKRAKTGEAGRRGPGRRPKKAAVVDDVVPKRRPDRPRKPETADTDTADTDTDTADTDTDTADTDTNTADHATPAPPLRLSMAERIVLWGESFRIRRSKKAEAREETEVVVEAPLHMDKAVKMTGITLSMGGPRRETIEKEEAEARERQRRETANREAAWEATREAARQAALEGTPVEEAPAEEVPAEEEEPEPAQPPESPEVSLDALPELSPSPGPSEPSEPSEPSRPSPAPKTRGPSVVRLYSDDSNSDSDSDSDSASDSGSSIRNRPGFFARRGGARGRGGRGRGRGRGQRG